MKSIRPYTLLFLVLLGQAPAALAQSGAKIIVDAQSRQPLDYVSIQSNDNAMQLMSNREGKFIVVPNAGTFSFTFYRMGYEKQVVFIKQLLTTDTIFMRERAQALQEVTVSAEKLQPIVKDKRFYVEDYCILPNNDFLILPSRTIANAFEVCYYSWDKGIRLTTKLKGEAGD